MNTETAAGPGRRKAGDRAAKASNALVATVDFYASELGEALATVDQQQGVIEAVARQLHETQGRLGEEVRKREGREEEVRRRRRLPPGSRGVARAVARIVWTEAAEPFRKAERGTPANELYAAGRFVLSPQRPLDKGPLPAGSGRVVVLAQKWIEALTGGGVREARPDGEEAKALVRALDAMDPVGRRENAEMRRQDREGSGK